MRRFRYWILPLAAAVVAALTFGAGFYSFLRGDTGSPVTLVPPSGPRAPSSAPRGMIVPIVLGDSLARGTGDETGLGIGGRLVAELRRRRMPVSNAVNLAVNGAKTHDLEEQLTGHSVRTLVAESNVIIVSIGGNDLWGESNFRNAMPRDPGRAANDVLDHVTAAVRAIRAANPTARVFLIGLYNPFVTTPFGRALTPLVNRWNATLVERFADDRNVVVVQTSDLFAYRDRLSFDRFHPADEGYELIAWRIADAL
jgi:lysophospholipase L1-like esterase